MNNREGTLPDNGIKELFGACMLVLEDRTPEDYINPESLDIPIGHRIWRMRGSRALNPGEKVENLIKNMAKKNGFSIMAIQSFLLDMPGMYCIKQPRKENMPQYYAIMNQEMFLK